MKSISLKTKIISGVITGGMILSSVSVFAATTNKSNTDAQKSSEQVQRDTKRQENMDTNLAKLVTDKTITQAQADKIKAATITEEAAHKAEREKTKEMTEAQRKTYMEANKGKHVKALESLVANGTITQAQSDKIGPGALGGPGKHAKPTASQQLEMDAKRQADLDTKLKSLVTAKTITQTQADKIKAATVAEEAIHKADREKTESMTEAERKTYMEANKDKHVKALESLVDNDTITQAQADAVRPGPGKDGLGKGPKGDIKLK